ncbi:MAG: metallophosphoesterase [Verrucomicrobiae bacterium]|nr:metallophosphoesterase [Verrucomicrobiae bacterium]
MPTLITQNKCAKKCGPLLASLWLAAGCFLAPAASHAETIPSSWSFVVAADPHLRENRKDEPAGVEKFRRVLSRIGKIDPKPDFMLLLGDIHPDKLPSLLPEIKIPIHPVHGNHETPEQRQTLRSLFPDDFQGKDFYRFEHRGCLFIALCTAASIDHVGHLAAPTITPPAGQREWLEEQLRDAPRFQHCFIYGHIPPDAQCRANDMCLAPDDSKFLLDLVQKAKPTALFFGHRHQQIDFSIGGIPVYGVRSCNWNVKKEPLGFLLVKVESGKTNVEFIPTPP